MNNDNFFKPIEDNVEIWIDRDGCAPELFNIDGNLVVEIAKTAINDCITSSVTGDVTGFITTYKFGDAATPPDANPSDTANSDPSAIVKSFVADDIARNGTATVLTLTLEKDEGTSTNYTEATLHTADDRLFARILLNPTLPKDPTIRIRINWTLGY
ncbi:hypothetical protein NVP1031O_156 [Vibrio phage 1.031.O._10N.261.46.F8]|nr:hypothetical protein NVP1031O_156 [Vibrio phage 1.031.O._10N.261.46.F8]